MPFAVQEAATAKRDRQARKRAAQSAKDKGSDPSAGLHSKASMHLLPPLDLDEVRNLTLTGHPAKNIDKMAGSTCKAQGPGPLTEQSMGGSACSILCCVQAACAASVLDLG